MNLYINMNKRGQSYNIISKNLKGLNYNKDFIIELEIFINNYKKEREILEPCVYLSLFSDKKLGILECLVKCLKENFSMNFSKIAKLLNRNDRTIWTSYKNAKFKHKEKFNLNDKGFKIPFSVFASRNRGPLQNLIIFSKEELKLSFSEISKILNRNYTTIWLSYHNGTKKRGLNEKNKRY
jgi:hypothetical protein